MTTTTILPFDDRDGSIWFNGGMVPWREAKVHVLTHGLHYASCVFEGERVYGGRIFKLREHTERLFQSARILGFEIPFSVEEIEGASRDAVAAQKIENGYVRPVAWRGSEMMAVSARRNRIHVAIAAWTWPTYFGAEARAKGYIKGTLKKEEFFGLVKRVTTPSTIYKKQKLDRDDIVDITDFDVVLWLKAEMRPMLDEEVARAILIGDGRAVDDEDKIRDPAGAADGAGIRSILHAHDLYAATITRDVDGDLHEPRLEQRHAQRLAQDTLQFGLGIDHFFFAFPAA